MKSWFSILFIFLTILYSCEKRFEIEGDYDYEEAQIFCELIGVPEIGFVGQVGTLRPINDPSFPQGSYQIIISENSIPILDTIVRESGFSWPYRVQGDAAYRLEINAWDQHVYSDEEFQPIGLGISEFSAREEFVDSLGFDVVTMGFDLTNASDASAYYLLYYALLSDPMDPFVLSEAELADTISGGRQIAVSKRLANIESLKFGRSAVVSIDYDLFQYLKNVQGLGLIPSDRIKGHQGNLQNGIGYFGLVNTDFRIESL